MIADTARISKLEYAYETPPASSHSDTKSQKTNSYYEGFYSDYFNSGTLYDAMKYATAPNLSLSYIAWTKVNNTHTGHRYYTQPIRYISTGGHNTSYTYSPIIVRHYRGRGPTIRAYIRTNAGSSRSHNFYSYNAGTVPDDGQYFNNWMMLSFSLYKPSLASTSLSCKFYINNTYIGVHTYASTYFANKGLFIPTNYYMATTSTVFHSSGYCLSQNATYYGTDGQTITQADVDAHYNNGVPADWSNITMSSGHNIISNYLFGDSANDSVSTPLIEDQSSNNLDMDNKMYTPELISDAP